MQADWFRVGGPEATDDGLAALDALAAEAEATADPLEHAGLLGRLGDGCLRRGLADRALGAYERGITTLVEARVMAPFRLPAKRHSGPSLPPIALVTAISAPISVDSALPARLRLGAGQAYLMQGQPGPARALLSQTLASAASDALPDDLVAAAHLGLCVIAYSADPPDEAAVRDHASAVIDASPVEAAVLRARLMLASVSAGSDGVLALSHFVDAIGLARQTGDPYDDSLALALLAEVLPTIGRTVSRAALDAEKRAGSTRGEARTLHVAAGAAAASGDPAAAASLLRDALSVVGAGLASTASDEARVSRIGMASGIRGGLVDVELDRGDTRAALAAAEEGRGTSFEMALTEPGSDHRRAFVGPRLVYYVAPHRTVIFYVDTDQSVRVHLCPWGEERLRLEVGRLQRAWRLGTGLRGVRVARPPVRHGRPPVADTREPARALHQQLVQPFEHLLPRDGKPLIIEPAGPLWGVPFAALSDRDGHPLAAHTPVLLSPSARVTSLLQSLRRSRYGRQALVVGDPSMPLVDGVELDPLPGAGAEARSVATRLGQEHMTGDTATVDAFLTRARTVGVLHLATHGLSDPLSPNDAFLALAPEPGDDGLLRASTLLTGFKESMVAQHALAVHTAQPWMDVDLAVLSACQTALGSVTDDGVIGLCRAFLSVGVKTVVASLWSVDDEATRALMEAFYEGWDAGAHPVEAMRAAAMKIREQLPDPRLWAPFVVMGAGVEPLENGRSLIDELEVSQMVPRV